MGLKVAAGGWEAKGEDPHPKFQVTLRIPSVLGVGPGLNLKQWGEKGKSSVFPVSSASKINIKLDSNYLRIWSLSFVIHPFIFLWHFILSGVLHKSITLG